LGCGQIGLELLAWPKIFLLCGELENLVRAEIKHPKRNEVAMKVIKFPSFEELPVTFENDFLWELFLS
jgi:hypothetical protein